MNLSKEEYNRLTFQEKLALKSKQTELDTKIHIERLKNERSLTRHHHELALIEQQNVQNLYNKSNEKLFVSIHNGQIKNMKNGYFIAPFEIVPYEAKKIPIYSQNSRYKQYDLWVSFQNEGFYIAIEPPKEFKHLKSFVYSNMQKLIENAYYKPIILPRSRKWYKEHTYDVSLKNSFEAKNLHITLYLKNEYR